MPTVGKWRSRFVKSRLDGLVDGPRSGRKPTITAEQVDDVVVATLESTPAHATHWSRKKMTERSGLSKSTIGRIWRGIGLKPHLIDGFKLSNEPLFADKTYDVVGRYLNPPESAVVLCMDEKSACTAGTAPSSSRKSSYREVLADLAVHLVCDNYGTHKTPAGNTWLAAHPRFQIHFTPTCSSWLNQVERFFGFVTEDLLQRSQRHRPATGS